MLENIVHLMRKLLRGNQRIGSRKRRRGHIEMQFVGASVQSVQDFSESL